ncbi:unnamed protein product [Lasius platythorax]
MVPGARVSSSSVGPTSPLTGGKSESATVMKEAEVNLKDSLGLTFVDCLSTLDMDTQIKEASNIEVAVASTPSRAQKISPDAVSISDGGAR